MMMVMLQYQSSFERLHTIIKKDDIQRSTMLSAHRGTCMVDRSLLKAVDESEYVCWTRMQAESGEELPAIIARKEVERLGCGGIFFWGVGTAPSRRIPSLVKKHSRIPVVFSIMRTNPRPADTNPGRIVRWRKYMTADGSEQSLPSTAMVTSRGDGAKGPKKRHYALVCRSDTPLVCCNHGPFDPTAYRNASARARPVAPSQVTVLLQWVGPSHANARYRINLAAWLTDGYWVRLCDPVEVSSP